MQTRLLEVLSKMQAQQMNYASDQYAPINQPALFDSDEYWFMPEIPEEQVKECFRAYKRFSRMVQAPQTWPKAAFHFQYFSGKGILKDEAGCQSHCVVFWISNGIRRCMLAKPKKYHERNCPFVAGLGRGFSDYSPGQWGKVQIKFEDQKVRPQNYKFRLRRCRIFLRKENPAAFLSSSETTSFF